MYDKTSVAALLQDYIPAISSYNELSYGSDTIRPEWQTFLTSLKEIGAKELVNRTNDISRLLRENGVAYNIYNDPSGQTRPWELDAIPQILTAEEWSTINAGLIQRAELLDLLLKDIYGPQTLIKEGIIPQELIYLHPGFLRPCAGIDLPNTHHLIFYAADIARGTDGQLWVISDRTQAPSGSGYALENRFAISSVLPELFTNLNVKRLSPYFDSLQQALKVIAPHNSENPRIVILTPGPDNETYFEHSYLAAYLGLTLVQGSDLMVKDNYVWLKTIDGLEKIDVILRRMDDIYCDPLELKSDSLLGIPGLLQVIRKGNVALANPLGSSVVENAGLVPFLPAIAKHFWGTELLTPSIATWWCGQEKEMQYVIDNIRTLVIRRIFRDSSGRSAIDGATLSPLALAKLIDEIKTNPYLFVGQEKINFSSSPYMKDGVLHAGHSLIRSFLVRHNNSYYAMPGGLTRCSPAENSFVISNQTGGLSKDTWVLASGDDQDHTIKLNFKPDESSAALQKRSLPSQTAENLFWVGRYTERVIYNARLQRTVMQYMLQNNHTDDNDVKISRELLLQTLTHCTYTYPGFIQEEDNPLDTELILHPWKELTDILFNEERPGSLSNNLLQFKRAVYSVRNFWALDTWRVLLQLEENWNHTKLMLHHDHLAMISSIDQLNTSMFAFLGMNRESVRREQGWHILDLGRKTEQSLNIINLLRTAFFKKESEQTEHDLIESVLISTQSLITYRYTYRDHLQLPLMLELMMLDINYPKSLVYLINKIKKHIEGLPKTTKNQSLSEQERLMLEADTLLKLANGATLAQADSITGEYTALHQFLDKLYGLIAESSQLVSKTYFKHSVSQKQLYISSLI